MLFRKLALAAFLCFGVQMGSIQQTSGVPRSDDKISFGSVDLRLGMTKQYVLSQLTRAGFSLRDWGTSTIGVVNEVPGRDSVLFVGNMSFKGDKLLSVRKDWLPNGGDDGLSVGEGIYGVFSNFASEGRTKCEIASGTNQSPNGDVKEIAIFCKPGQKYISIEVVHSPIRNGVTVTEILK
jgi:hypothetical protein